MTRSTLLAALALAAFAVPTTAPAEEGILYPYAGGYPRSHPDYLGYVIKNPYAKYPQSTYRWDPQRQTWYYTGPNWRYWNPSKRVVDPIMPVPDWPVVPSGVYVRP